MASPLKELKYADGRVVTAQEAYDAFMNTRVLIVIDGTTYEAISMLWYDNNSAQSDPTNVGYVIMRYLTNDGVAESVSAGDSSLKPTSETT